MPGSLEAPLARALEFHNAKQSRLANADWLLHLLRSDPAVTEALAEALEQLDVMTNGQLSGDPKANRLGPNSLAANLLDALLGPRESAGGMEP